MSVSLFRSVRFTAPPSKKSHGFFPSFKILNLPHIFPYGTHRNNIIPCFPIFVNRFALKTRNYFLLFIFSRSPPLFASTFRVLFSNAHFSPPFSFRVLFPCSLFPCSISPPALFPCSLFPSTLFNPVLLFSNSPRPYFSRTIPRFRSSSLSPRRTPLSLVLTFPAPNLAFARSYFPRTAPRSSLVLYSFRTAPRFRSSSLFPTPHSAFARPHFPRTAPRSSLALTFPEPHLALRSFLLFLLFFLFFLFFRFLLFSERRKKFGQERGTFFLFHSAENFRFMI